MPSSNAQKTKQIANEKLLLICIENKKIILL